MRPLRSSPAASALVLALLASVVLRPSVAAAQGRTWSKPGVRASFVVPDDMFLVDDPAVLGKAAAAAGTVVDLPKDVPLGVQFLLQQRPAGMSGTNATLSLNIVPADKTMRGMTSEQFAKATYDGMPLVIPAARALGPISTRVLGGETFHEMDFEFVTQGVVARTRQWVRYDRKDKYAYVFSIADGSSTFDESARAFEPVLESISFAGRTTSKAEDLVTATARVRMPDEPAAGAVVPGGPRAPDPVPGKDYAEEILITWEPARSESARLIESLMRKNALFENVVKGLDYAFHLPRPLRVKYAEAGVVNAWYAPDEHSVTMTYDLGVYLANVFISAGHPQEQALQMATDAMIFVLLHELGHALIGEMDLPTTGKEEDSADEFATLVTAFVLPDVEAPSAKAAARWFDLQGGRVPDASKLLFWDEHSLDRQRTYRILANLFAHSPKRFRFAETMVPAERLQEAQVRWPSKPDRWGRLLRPWLEEGASGTRGGVVLPPAGVVNRDAGTITFGMRNIRQPRSLQLQQVFAQNGVLNRLAGDLDRAFVMPRDLSVHLEDRGDMRSFYDPVKAEIVISLDFLWHVDARLRARFGDEAGGDAFGGFVVYFLFQELCRALLHEMHLAFTGEEEDAAAELTTLIMAHHPDGRSMIDGAVSWYQILTEENVPLEQLRLWSAASLDQQRFYDVLGLLHASDPAAYAFVTTLIPPQRLARAAREFPAKTAKWDRHLGPWAAGAQPR